MSSTSRIAIGFFSLGLLSCAHPTMGPGPGTPITAEGWGPVNVGMTPDQMAHALGAPLSIEANFTDSDECLYMHSDAAPGLRFMIEEHRLVRVETSASVYSTSEGVRVGDTPASAREAYSDRLQIKPHKYDPDGYYVVIGGKTADTALLIEVSEGRVVEIRGGLEPAVEYVEGCL